MAEPLEARTSSSRVAWIVAAVATTLAVVFAIVAIQSGPDLRTMQAHGHGATSGQAERGHMGMSQNMMAGDEQDFLVEMIAHHQEAVTAAAELERSDRSQMRELGRSIVTGQTAEIDQMQTWLEAWYDDAGQASYEPMMRDLQGLDGDDLDQVFLEDMVMHHHMAVMMSRHLLTDADDLHPEVADLARDIISAQSAEIRQMRRWLVEWFDVRGGMGWHMGMGGMGADMHDM
ncbi:DUF305 domain-containing protein [Nocardioides piscis]|uniref:DUF305 domain-containing protein n=1 Tax=Nocardioides piscis TaxID=2714938 RepID=A0A6G7YJ60_9ACTN|nr:DUF305 domain-containing protein [Nocardioides piscis]QIK76783.1 DUF305 domain-containing protein [Nocardioides piscis]